MKPKAPKERDPKGGDTDSILSDIVGVIIIALCFILIVFVNKAEASEHCEGWAMQAEHIMQARQEHMTLEEITQRLSDANDIPAEAKPTFTKIIEAAYGVPIFNKISDKKLVIEDFAKNVFIGCLQNTAKNS